MGGVTLLLILSLFQRFIGFGRNILVCRYLDPDELGRWNMAFNVLLLAAPLLVLGIPGTFGRFVEHFRARAQLRSFLKRAIYTTFITATVGLAVMFLMRDQLTWLVFRDPNQKSLFLYTLVALASVVVFNFFIQLITALRQPKTLSYLNFLNSFLFTAIAVTVLVTTKFGAKGVVIAYGLSCLLSLLAGIRLLSRKRIVDTTDTKPLLRSDLWAKLAPFASWLWINDLLANTFDAVDRTMIVHFAADDPSHAISLVGQYHSSRILGILVIAFAEMLSSVLLPYLSHDWEAGRKRRVGKQINFALKLIAISLTCMCAGMLLVAPPIFGKLMGGKYTAGLEVLPITLAYCIWWGIFLVAQNYMWLTQKAKFSNLALVGALVCNGALNYLLLPRFGLAGAVVATSIANILAVLLVLNFANRTGLPLYRGTVVSLILPASLMLGAFGALVSVVIALWIAIQTNWIFSVREKSQLLELFEARFAKLMPFGGSAMGGSR